MAGVVGLLLAALYHPVWTSAIHAPADFALRVPAFGLLTSGAATVARRRLRRRGRLGDAAFRKTPPRVQVYEPHLSERPGVRTPGAEL